MAIFSFDHYSQTEIPPFYLANPDETILYNLGTIYNRKFELRYNTLSTLTFTAPSYVDGVKSDYYDSLEYRRLVYVDNVGTFMITGIEIQNDGVKEIKEITCQSLEVILSYKKLSLFEGTYTFNNVISGSGVTTSNLMTTVLSYIPGWTLGTIDSTLTNITRSFEVTDKTLYDFLVNDVSQTYQCVFVFDSINKTISAYSAPNATTATDIYVSFDNLMKNFKISESTEELVTAMNVLGGDGISINYVNPLGTNTIYNFDYYKTTAWMTQDLIDAIDAWEASVNLQQPIYANLLTGLRIENTTLLTMQTDLVTLEGELSALTLVRDAQIQQGLDTTAVSASMTVVSGSIVILEADIVNQESIISGINTQLAAINTSLSFESNFTSAQLSTLNNFIIGNTYTNVNFIRTSLMSEVDVQNISQELYDQAQSVLVKVSQPRYDFEIDSVNYLFIPEYQTFIDQTELGCTMMIQLTTSASTVATLLGIDFNYDNPTDFKITLSNRLRLDDEKFQYQDLFGATVDAGITTNFNSQKWNSTSANYTTAVGTGNSLVATTTTSNTNNLVLFSDITGTRIKDGDAIYLAPTSFNPAITSASATFTYNYQKGYYSVIGRTLFFEIALSLASISGSTTQATSISMPILHKNVANLSATFKAITEDVTFGAGYNSIVGVMPSNSAVLSLYKEGSALPLSPLLTSSFSGSATKIYIDGHYFIN